MHVIESKYKIWGMFELISMRIAKKDNVSVSFERNTLLVHVPQNGQLFQASSLNLNHFYALYKINGC